MRNSAVGPGMCFWFPNRVQYSLILLPHYPRMQFRHSFRKIRTGSGSDRPKTQLSNSQSDQLHSQCKLSLRPVATAPGSDFVSLR